MKSIVVIIDYFGDKWPEWFPIFLESCRSNRGIDWLLHSNCTQVNNTPENVLIHYESEKDYALRVNRKLNTLFESNGGYKLCDLRPLYGVIYEDEIREYDFWAYGDIDVVYGDILKVYTSEILKNNVISDRCMGGHLCLIRNKKWLRHAFLKHKDWKHFVNHPEYQGFDERFTDIFRYPVPQGRKRHLLYDMKHPFSIRYRKKIYFNEKHAATSKRANLNIPKTWYWKPGSLTNNLDGKAEFAWLQLMNFKHDWCVGSGYGKKLFWEKLPRLVYLDKDEFSRGIRIDQYGFHKLEEPHKSPALFPREKKPGENEPAVVIKLSDGMGNQMFQYACAYALAKRTQKRLYFDTQYLGKKHPYRQFRQFELGLFKLSGFGLTETVKKLRQPFLLNQDRSGFVQEASFMFSRDILNAEAPQIYLNGYFQSEKYFTDVSNDVRNEFKFPPFPDERNLELKDHIQKNNSVGLHVRRGDFVTNNFWGVCPLSYYDKAIKLVAEAIQDPVFFVFSDDPQWAYKNLKIPYETVFVSHNTNHDSYRDMQLMALCKHNVIANSAFSWWAAWLNSNPKKMVISPKQWFANKMMNKNTSDLIPEQWIRI